MGDVNRDGIFNSRDLVAVFIAGGYEDDLVGNSGWASGDWNCDGEFTSSDLIRAFAEGAYTESSVVDFVWEDRESLHDADFNEGSELTILSSTPRSSRTPSEHPELQQDWQPHSDSRSLTTTEESRDEFFAGLARDLISPLDSVLQLLAGQ